MLPGQHLSFEKIYRLPQPGASPQSFKQGYVYWRSPVAAQAYENVVTNFIYAERPLGNNEEIQWSLIKLYKNSSVEIKQRAEATLCLRCQISSSIVKACKKQAIAFGPSSGVQGLLQELLAIALDDDGKKLFALSLDNTKKIFEVNQSGEVRSTHYHLFNLEILAKYDVEKSKGKSLLNWAYDVTLYHEKIKKVLGQVGFKRLSDWALMSRARKSQLKKLSKRSCQIVEVFQAVYKRDRLKARQQESFSVMKKCPEPTVKQLSEICSELEHRDIYISSSTKLLRELQRIAQKLQEVDLWMSQGSPETENLEQHNFETGITTLRRDIPITLSNNPEIIEDESILKFLREKQDYALEYGVQQEIEDRLNNLQKGRRKIHASKFIPGLKLMYCDGASQRLICDRLDFPSQSLVARIFAPKELAHRIRDRSIEKLLDLILAKAKELGLTPVPPTPDYLRNVIRNIELLLDTEIFEIAIQELQNPKKDRILNSLYAQKLRKYLNQV